MSKYQQRDMSGSLFKNEKEKGAHPDYRGECLIDGKPYYMDAWLKTAESGRKWMSFSFRRKDEKSSREAQAKSRARDDEEDLPF